MGVFLWGVFLWVYLCYERICELEKTKYVNAEISIHYNLLEKLFVKEIVFNSNRKVGTFF